MLSGPTQPSVGAGRMLQAEFVVSGEWRIGLSNSTPDARPPTPDPRSPFPRPWSTETVAGHPCDVYLPPERSKHGYVVLYLHGVHMNRLDDKPAFTAQFDSRGLAVVAPQTKRSWWTDKICSEFDKTISAEQHVLKNVLPFIDERLGAKPPRIGLLGTSMGGQGALRLAYKHPNLFPVAAAISPAPGRGPSRLPGGSGPRAKAGGCAGPWRAIRA